MNTGSSVLSVLSIFIGGPNSSDFAPQTNNCPGSLAVNANCQVNVKFKPSALGTRTASIIFKDNANDTPQTVTLSGTRTGQPPVATFSTMSVSFGNQTVGTTSTTQMVTLTNTGSTPLSIVSIFISGTNTPDFAAQTNNCPTNLAVNASCQISLQFTPSALGTRTASIIFKDNASNSPQTVALGGTGQ